MCNFSTLVEKTSFIMIPEETFSICLLSILWPQLLHIFFFLPHVDYEEGIPW